MTSPFIQQIADNRVCQVLTCLPEKFVVDFANGIDVAQEHIRTAVERTFFRRLKEGLTGEGAARQNAINASLAQGVEASLRWLTELTTSLATTNYAIINTLYTDDATYKAAIDKALKPVGLDGLFGKDGVMNGPGGDVIPVQINGKIWLESTACKSNACGWEYITTLYNPQTHVVVGYYYNVDPGYLVWFGDIGVNEFAYLVKKYVATVN